MKTLPPFLPALAVAAALLAGCERADDSAAQKNRILQEEVDVRAAQLLADQRLRDLEQRLVDAEKLQNSDREAELARVREELAQLKADREQAAERLRELEAERAKQAATALAENKPAGPGNSLEADRRYLESGMMEELQEGPMQAGQPVPETQYVERVEAFYEPLEPYGAWLETEDYGYVYQPSIAISVNTWHPYTDGCWVNSNYGWTWASNEPFGWATYHYGRWARLQRVGWCWVPGREWGPAWVSWRRGADHCGWAPLPPQSRGRVSFTATVDRDYDLGPAAYRFVALRDFGASSYSRVVLRPEDNVRIINQTVNITDINYRREKNRSIVYNGGPRFDSIRALAREPVQSLQVEFASQPITVANAGSRNVRRGDRLEFAAPAVQANWSARPNRVREKIGSAVLENGWENIEPDRARLVRQEIVETSRPLRRQQNAADAANQQAAPGQPRPGREELRERIAVQPSVGQPATAKPEGEKPATPAAGNLDRSEPGQKARRTGVAEPSARPEVQPAVPAPEPVQQPPATEQRARITADRLRDEQERVEKAKPKLERFQAQEPGQSRPGREIAPPSGEQQSRPSERQAQRGVEQQATQDAPRQAEAVRQAAEAMQRQAVEAQRQAAETQRQAAQAEQQAAEQASVEAQRQAAEQARQQAAAQQQALEQARRKKGAEQSQQPVERQRQAAEQAQRKALEQAQQQAQEQARKAQQKAEQQPAKPAQRNAQRQSEQQAVEQARQQAAQRNAERQAQQQAEQAAQQAAVDAQQRAGQAQRNAQKEAQRQAEQQAAEGQRQAAEKAQRNAERQAQQQAVEQVRRQAVERHAAEQAQQQSQQQAVERVRQQTAEQMQQRAQQQAERAQQMEERQSRQQAAQQQAAQQQAAQQQAAQQQAAQAAQAAQQQAAEQQGGDPGGRAGGGRRTR